MALTKVTSGGLDGTFPDDSIVNADINSSAAIALSKLATDPSNASNLASGTVPDARFTTLPAVSGANLTNLTAGNLSSGTVPTARLGSGSASSSVFLAGDSSWIAAGGGKMGQFLSTTKTDTFGIVSDSVWTSITGFSVDITPSATSSKIWIWYHLERSNYSNAQNMSTRLRRDTTVIGVGTAAGSRHVVTTGPYKAENDYNMPNTHGFLDSPSSTSAITYDVQILGNGSAQQINYYGADSDTAFSGRSVSTISVMEVLA